MRRYSNECERCHCSLDPAEGRYCEDCQREMEQDAAYAKRWCLTLDQVRSLRQEGLVGEVSARAGGETGQTAPARRRRSAGLPGRRRK